MRPADLLAQIPLFQGLTDDDREALATRLTEKTFHPGDLVFSQGEAGVAMYVVKSGDLQILDGNHVYETVSAGAVIGEMAVVDGGPRSATVRAIAPSVVIPVDQRRFLFMVQQTPFFALRLMGVMARRLRAMNERVKASD